ncbi:MULTISPECIES: SbmA/BacA-like family transporter [Rhizobium]|uniref:ABC transporter ATP-binding protein/permease n=1 Tax=Rhizobium TaxID=379 RepID=UPI001B33B0E0|nr:MULTISPECIES: SbmA/BacA-like family transporter [Rhizobium]MBX4908486.1 ABC transporter ATP-binding protein/permease [Rhizobium bangladeshense]MBX5226260.1 ABC transporter ATP-binding protein/permease [Rhizobium sp. NLR9b]MBX5257619.1 ABC transporter ATP-binding protein/permease [Rhizobium sp. NLR16b]MBX5263712.1 ABC transporter ATP-binding protein/permease [Rhizobium sp. NLR16a]MBX5286933.1 ABC transporter ATP-binding protein/permease [Rhizobium sp. NLR10b]
MSQQPVPLKLTARRFVRAVKIFMTSDVGRRARLLLVALVALFGGISALNVVNSYVGRYFMTAIAEKQTAEFIRQAILYTGAFAASTIVAVIARLAEERLALLWREFLTRRAIGFYMSDGTFYRVGVRGKLSHPDQRIAEDIKAFTITTLSFVLMLLNSALTILTFSSVLWLISPLLFIAAVVYAAFGSYMTIVLGRPLINLNHDQLDGEAAFRSSLIRVRENAESIVIAGEEQRHANLLLRQFDALAANFRRIIVVNRNVGYFTTGYNWMIQIIPVVIIAPAFFRGDMEFGVITQSAAAFAMLVGAFSFIVRQFNSISNFATVVARISSLLEAIEEAGEASTTDVDVYETEGKLAYEQLTLTSPTQEILLKNLSMVVPIDTRLIVAGEGEAAGTALFRVTAGIGACGTGRVRRPPREHMRFIAQRSYFAPGTLRQILVPTERPTEEPDDEILGLLKRLGLARPLTSTDLDEDQDWSTLLSPREQQLIAIASVLITAPSYVVVEKADTIFGHELLAEILKLLADRKIACINFAEADAPRAAYDAVLEYHADGSWRWIDQGKRP